MGETRRVNLRKILGDADLRRKLMVSTIQATQAREGIITSSEQAQRAYYVVSEGERTAFFDLLKHKGTSAEPDRRHQMFVRALRKETENVRSDVARRDFRSIDGAPLAYRRVGMVSHIFRQSLALDPTWGTAAQGLATADDSRFVRCRWEMPENVIGAGKDWVPFAKGGEFSRFYADVFLLVFWRNNGDAIRNYDGAYIRNEHEYFKSGLTWPLAAGLFNARLLPKGCIFGHKGPAVILRDDRLATFVSGVLNSSMALYLLKVYTSREEMGGRWEVGVVKRLPMPVPTVEQKMSVGEAADAIRSAKAQWDEGNEISGGFQMPWIVSADLSQMEGTISARLDELASYEAAEDTRINNIYDRLNRDVYRLYGIPARTEQIVERDLGERVPEVIWPQMEGRTPGQKRMEHVWRLLSYAVKRVVEADEDGLVPFVDVAGEISLLDRMHEELGRLFPGRDVNDVEVEIVNELRRKVKGYDRAESIGEWLESVYFSYHASMYKNRPIFWHISSNQGKGPAAFSALVHYHRFDKDQMAKLQGVYLREALATFRREAALAGQEGRADDRLEWQAKVEEVEELGRRLKHVQEGFHHGADDFRILTPWKTEGEHPKGWDPDINDGVKVNIEPLQRAGILRIPEVI